MIISQIQCISGWKPALKIPTISYYIYWKLETHSSIGACQIISDSRGLK